MIKNSLVSTFVLAISLSTSGFSQSFEDEKEKPINETIEVIGERIDEPWLEGEVPTDTVPGDGTGGGGPATSPSNNSANVDRAKDKVDEEEGSNDATSVWTRFFSAIENVFSTYFHRGEGEINIGVDVHYYENGNIKSEKIDVCAQVKIGGETDCGKVQIKKIRNNFYKAELIIFSWQKYGQYESFGATTQNTITLSGTRDQVMAAIDEIVNY